MDITILDGYVDEPSRLGVPPFISPHARYCSGAVIDAGGSAEYMTVDHWRGGRRPAGEVLFIISGALVPGKYLRTMPMSRNELADAIMSFDGEVIVWHSAKPPDTIGNAVHIWGCDPDAFIHDLLASGKPEKRRRTGEEWAAWAVGGAGVITRHQDFPQPLIAEIDMSYGCPHYMTGGCSFCTEPLFGEPVFRSPESILSEFKALLKTGCTNFRLGGSSCIFSYMAEGIGEAPAPRPNANALARLFKSLSKLEGIRVLHTDNGDASVIAGHPEESMKILQMVVSTCTSGNILSLGLESADPVVAERNNLNSNPEEVMAAIRMINRAGSGMGPSGLPKLLPGLNFLAGLEAETAMTFQRNMDFLESVVSDGLLLRRINIRQVSPARKMFARQGSKKHFIRFKEQVREKIDKPMLEKLAPRGTLLKDLYAEVRIGKLMFARQIGTYPILVGIPQNMEPGIFLDAKVTSHGSRSLTALEYPLDINACSLSALEALPGIGKKRAARLFRARPLESKEDIVKALEEPELAGTIIDYLGF